MINVMHFSQIKINDGRFSPCRLRQLKYISHQLIWLAAIFPESFWIEVHLETIYKLIHYGTWAILANHMISHAECVRYDFNFDTIQTNYLYRY